MGDGKLMVIGNPHYNSILRCPNGYSWNGGVNKDGQCTLSGDSDDMKNFMQNVLRYLSDDKWTPDAKASMTVGTNRILSILNVMVRLQETALRSTSIRILRASLLSI